jgi:hypothetical protein
MILLGVQISFQFHLVRHRENIITNIKEFSLAEPAPHTENSPSTSIVKTAM